MLGTPLLYGLNIPPLCAEIPMNIIENAQHDLFEAALSVETAIELLASLERDGSEYAGELHEIVLELQRVKGGLERSRERLAPLQASH